ncbi:MAG TPA: glycosyltransferase, partial [Chitinophagaceae bacterium]|nr:glycosyltransferase [Chitinophagaceae bacterium]
IIYDCMDELAAFKNAPPVIKQRGDELMKRADIVFTGGSSLYAARKDKHHSVHLFPSSIDRKHFGQAMQPIADPTDQSAIPHPRIGFFGVIDERMDIELLRSAATAKPEWQFVVLGPVVKIDPATLPSLPNIHYLGQKSYQELPAYLANWDVAMMPFAINESTKFISPTKTPEYLAAGKPVVSTAITDVVDGYGKTGLVYIANDAGEFVDKIEAALHIKDRTAWLKEVDSLLAQGSWDRTVEQMNNYINAALTNAAQKSTKEKEDAYV